MEKALESNPYLELSELREMSEDADKFHALKTVLQQEGGQLMVDALVSDAISGLGFLRANYYDCDRDKLVSVIAKIDANLSLVDALVQADENLKAADEALDEALRV